MSRAQLRFRCRRNALSSSSGKSTGVTVSISGRRSGTRRARELPFGRLRTSRRRSGSRNAYLKREHGVTVVITHPCHPLHGQEVIVLQFHRQTADPRVVIEGPDGVAHVLPISWTDRALPSEHVACSGSGARLSGLAVLDLLAFLDTLRECD